MATTTETAAQNARTVADQSRVLADEAIEAGRQVFDAYQGAYVAFLEGTFQAANRWFEINRLMLEQSEFASREAKGMLETVAAQTRKQQKATVDLVRDNARVVQSTWLGVYRNGRGA